MKREKIYVISQTTFSNLLFDTIVKLVKEKLPDVEIVVDKTICDATKKRQEECFVDCYRLLPRFLTKYIHYQNDFND